MTRFTSAVLSREEFLAWMGGILPIKPDARSRSKQLSIDDRDITLIWAGDKLSADNKPIIAISLSKFDEFFAFISTYVSTFKPYTAFQRVVPLELVTQIEGRRKLREKVAERLERMVVGGVLAERFLRSRVSSSKSFKSPLVAAKATLSASIGGALLAGYSLEAVIWVADQWRRVNVGGKERAENRPFSDVMQIWQQLASVIIRCDRDGGEYNEGHDTERLLIALIINGASSAVLSRFSGYSFADLDLGGVLAAPREERIHIFNRFVSNMGEVGTNKVEHPLLAGLLLAIVGNGSFDMLRSAKELSNRFPSSILWFGVFASLFDESNVLMVESGLGRRLLRDVSSSRSFHDSSNVDLNVSEYLFLTREADMIEQIIVENDEAFHLELLPDVSTYVPRRFNSRDESSQEEFHLLLNGFDDMRFVLDRLQQRLSRRSQNYQDDMFNSDAKIRGRTRRL